MKQTTLCASRAFKEICRSRIFFAMCLACPAFVLILMRLFAHYFTAFSSLPLQTLLAGAIVFSHSVLIFCFAKLLVRDRASLYHLSLRYCPVPPRSMFLGYLGASIWISVWQSAVCYLTAQFLSVFAKTPLPFSSFIALCFAQIPSVLFFSALGVLLGCISRGTVAHVAAAVFGLFSLAFGGAFFDLSHVGAFGAVCRALPASFAVRSAQALLLQDFSSFELRISFLFSCAYALGMAILAFAALRKRYQFQGDL